MNIPKESARQYKVSIIIPSFNRESLIHHTLDSLIGQTYSNWEAIIVDDGSTDRTIHIIKEYCKKDNRFHLYSRNRNPKGAPTCRNIGIEKAKGDYIIFLDSDDILFPHALKTRVNFLSSRKYLDFCVSNGLRGEYPINALSTYTLISTFKFHDVLKEFFNFTPPWVCLNPTYKIESLKSSNIYWDENLKGFQDIDFHTQTIINNLKFDYINDIPDCLWTAHKNGNIGTDMNKKGINLKQRFYIFNKYSIYDKYDFELKHLSNILLNNFYYGASPKIPLHVFFQKIKKINSDITSLDIILLTIYRFALSKKIPILPRIVRIFLKTLRSSNNYLKPIKNNHFLKNKYAKMSKII